MDNTCKTCRHWKPSKSGAMASLGAAICAFGPRWTFMSPNSGCERHQPAKPEQIEARKRLFSPSSSR